MRARWVSLRPLRDGDLGFIYTLMSSPASGGRVRFAGATPSPEQVAATLWENVLAQFVVEQNGSGEPIGLVAITSPNFRDGIAYMSALGLPEKQGSGLIATATMLGFNYAFSTWPFRKIYMEATEDSYRQFSSGLDAGGDGHQGDGERRQGLLRRKLFVEEARLREHVFWGGRYVDMVILAVYREVWAQNAAGLLARFGSAPAPDQGPA